MAWYRVASVNDVKDGEVIMVSVATQLLALYNVAGSFYATDNICTHERALLSDGFVDGDEIECCLHQARFNIRTGKVINGPATVDVRTYPVKVEDGSVFVSWDG